MITVQSFIEAVNFKITGGSTYCWNCFGPDARYLDAEESKEYTASIVFSAADSIVFIAEVHDYVNSRSYRWFNPDYVEAHAAEAQERKVDVTEAYEGVKFTTLDVSEDFLGKCRAISQGRLDYDTRVDLPLDLDEHTMFELMCQAHRADITLNQHIENILRQALNLNKETA